MSDLSLCVFYSDGITPLDGVIAHVIDSATMEEIKIFEPDAEGSPVPLLPGTYDILCYFNKDR